MLYLKPTSFDGIKKKSNQPSQTSKKSLYTHYVCTIHQPRELSISDNKLQWGWLNLALHSYQITGQVLKVDKLYWKSF